MNELYEEIVRLRTKVIELETQLQLEKAEIMKLRRWIGKLEEDKNDC